MTSELETRGRVLRSARALKAFFEQKLNIELELLADPPESTGTLHVPLDARVDGLWGLRASSELTGEAREEIFSAFQTVLGGVAHLDQRRAELRRAETTILEMPENVIPFRRTPTVPARTPVNDQRYILKLDCLIEAKYLSEIHKMATELHTQSSRYAFLDIRDLDPAARTRLPDLLSLGAVNLFVPDVLHLSMREQEVLKDLMWIDSQQRPLLMVGTTMPYSDLRSVAGVHLEFLALLSRAYIKLTKPFQEYKRQNLIHYFLDSLANRPPDGQI